MKMKPLLLILAASVLILSSCYKNETVYYDQLDVTYTQYDTEFNFSSYTSFWLPDSISLKTNYLTDTEIDDIFSPGGTSEKTLEIVKQKFMDRGYVLASDSSVADFIASPTVLMIKSTSVSYYPPGWWYGYPGYGWGYPGWGYPGWGYPGYGGGGYVSYNSYKEGTIILEMMDGASLVELYNWSQDGASDIPEIKVPWLAAIDGYLSSQGSYNQERAQRGIDEAFNQSPYLKK